MPVRAPNLEEWFFIYAHTKIWQQGFYVPGSVDIDVSDIAAAYAARAQTPPYTAILLKAVAQMAAARPAINRLVCKTVFGPRVIQFDSVRVMLPVLSKHEGRPYARLDAIQSPEQLTIEAISVELRSLKMKPLAKRSLTGFCLGHKNRWYNRLLLRLLWFVVQNLPSFVERNGGALAVSSLLGMNKEHHDIRAVALGPSALSFTATTIEMRPDGRTQLKLGVCYNHLVCRGDEAFDATVELSRLLRGQGPDGLAPYLA